MDKKLKKGIIFVVIFFIIILFWSLNSERNEENKNSLINKDSYSRVQEIHWAHMPLTYSLINGSCEKFQEEKVVEAINIIENSTEGFIKFIQTEGEADIKFRCISTGEKANQPCYSSYCEETVGEAEYFIGGNIISKVSINFYYDLGEGACMYLPAKEIHEILHGFGFDHYTNKTEHITFKDDQDIMYPELHCNLQRELQEKYVSCLKYIYSDGKFEGNCSGVNFVESNSIGICPEGTYEVRGSNFCCPEPNMEISEEGYCF